MCPITLRVFAAWGFCVGSSGAPTETAVVSGRVVHDGVPLPNARVIAAVPAINMRDLDTLKDSGVQVFETLTNERGEYELTVDFPSTGPVEASFDARCEGYRSSAGTMISGGDFLVRSINPGDALMVDFKLPKAMYVSGRIIDEDGLPVEGVEITTTIHGGTWYADVGVTQTKDDGTFRIYDIPSAHEEPGDCQINFRHPDYDRVTLKHVWQDAKSGRLNLAVTLPRGNILNGRVLDRDGSPVADVLVRSFISTGKNESLDGSRAARTDADGRFMLKGMPDGRYVVEAIAPERSEHGRSTINVHGDTGETVIALQPIDFTGKCSVQSTSSSRQAFPFDWVLTKHGGLFAAVDPSWRSCEKPVELFGMLLATVTPRIRKQYGLPDTAGVIVLDAGENPSRFGIGDIRAGDTFWMVGDDAVEDIVDFLVILFGKRPQQRNSQVSPPEEPHEVRVVYLFRRVSTDGRWYSNTQTMMLTDKDWLDVEKAYEMICSRPR